ncbi:MAG TPA: glycoside hydrolase family 3 N-terminal domain-containing protein [Ureibacillus sp.]|nr:glycoside hydrolase family 3 N-terminal domain-containing protein [Ureibacillus sp.]
MVKLKKLLASSIVIVFTSSLILPMFQVSAEQVLQPNLGVRIKSTLSIDGNVYKDLNGNGQLDPYENWQLSDEERARDLVSKMTLEEKAGLLLIPEFPQFEEGKLVLPNAYLDQNTRYFIFRDTPSANVIADYNNQLQEAAEGSRLGIPIMIISNPRNHATSIQALSGLGKQGQFSYWPNTLGLAATRDLKLIEDFSRITANEFRATGIRKIYGYSADVATDPLWPRIDETFGEHPALVSDIIFRIVKGYQGDVLNENSVTTTVRHFPGGGARDRGKDSYFEEGRFNIYPTAGSLLRYHLPPFRAAIEAETSSIMPYYAYPSNVSANQGLPPFSQTQQFEEVGFTFNKAMINDYLRAELGFIGYVNSDTSAVIDKAWGALDLTMEERYAKALNAGTNIFSGASDPTPIINAVNQGLVSESLVDRSAQYLITEMLMLGLFENPYVEPGKALEAVNDPDSKQRADDAHRKSIVLLRNDNDLLPLTDDKLQNMKLFVQVFPGGENGQNTQNLKDLIRKFDPNITVIDNIEEATHAFVWILPSMDLLGQSKITLTIGPDTGIFNIERVSEIQKKVPTITAIDFKNPWLINKIEPNAASVLATFGVKPESLLDVIRGKFNPVGKLPITIPASKEALENSAGDVPGFRKGTSYIYQNKNGDKYQYNFGLSY